MTLTIRSLSSILCLLVAGVFALVHVPSGHASPRLLVGIQDDAQVVEADDPTNEVAFEKIAELRAEVLRVNLWWSEVAPERPDDPRNPGDGKYQWAAYDEVVARAKEKDIEVLFTILGTPEWANGGKTGWFYAPSAAGTTLKDFAYAAAKRYDGTFKPDPDPASEPLPKVGKWTAWNEPNLSFWLRPLSFKPRRHLQALAGAYARICNAVRVGVHEAGAEAFTEETVACGVTAPTSKGRRFSYPPLTFLRAIKAAGAKFDVYGHNPHPRSPSETPNTRLRTANVITMGNIDLLMKQLTRSYGARKRLWLTEYGYQTKPQDRWVGVTWAKQATFLKQAYAKARKHPRIDMLVWFLLQDEPDRNGAVFGAPGWQSGLITAGGGTEKNAFAAFRDMPH